MAQTRQFSQMYDHKVPINDEPLDDNDVAELIKAYQEHDEEREHVIKRSREVQKAAKQAIFSLHRSDYKRAEELLKTAESVAKDLLPTIEQNNQLRDGSFSNALEEVVEAILFQHFLNTGGVLGWKQMTLPISKDEYIGGLLDFTGELNRYAVQRATRFDIESVKHCKNIVEVVMGKMLQIDFRNGNIRKKYDALKYCLKNMENQIYELSLYGGLQLRKQEEQQPVDNGAAE